MASEIPQDEIDDIVEDIADMIFLENGGASTDWTQYPFEYYRLFCIWRETERVIAERRQRNLDMVLKANFFKS